jgi:hypothetical protein
MGDVILRGSDPAKGAADLSFLSKKNGTCQSKNAPQTVVVCSYIMLYKFIYLQSIEMLYDVICIPRLG